MYRTFQVTVSNTVVTMVLDYSKDRTAYDIRVKETTSDVYYRSDQTRLAEDGYLLADGDSIQKMLHVGQDVRAPVYMLAASASTTVYVREDIFVEDDKSYAG